MHQAWCGSVPGSGTLAGAASWRGVRRPGISYPPIERLAVIGDRRTAALVAADGTIGWWCLPDFDDPPAFGSFLDAELGGYCYVGPEHRLLGRQHYAEDTFVLTTRWETAEGCLEATDAMLWPQDERPHADLSRRVILRCLRSTGGDPRYRIVVDPRADITGPATAETMPGGVVWRGSDGAIGLWCSGSLAARDGCATAEGSLRAGETVWLAIGPGEDPGRWSREAAHAALGETLRYWRRQNAEIMAAGPYGSAVRQTALLVELLSFAPNGAVVASPSANLPEHIGRGRNFDYRYSWIRDTSLAFSLLAEIGLTERTARYLDWVAGLRPGDRMPLQVLYRISGETRTGPVEIRDLAGYRGSRPVRFGNPADGLLEIDSFGYLADCALLSVEHGSHLSDRHWDMLVRLADFVTDSWDRPGASIWEITPEQQFVVGKVLSWVTLDRMLELARLTGRPFRDSWHETRDRIHADVCLKGYSEAQGTFRQRYGSDAVDAALLLIPLMRFLPADDARVMRTVARIERELSINGHIHRFVPAEVPHQGHDPVGEEEGSFLLCTCWLAHYWARLGEIGKARAALARVTAVASKTGLLSEGVDARSGALLGNMPLLFSHVEYARAILTVERAERHAAGRTP